jgi:hypothetical protein
MSTKGQSMAAAVFGMVFAAAPLLAHAGGDKAPAGAKEAQVKCEGANACKGTGGCKSADNACKGHNGCKGKGWILTTAKECKAKGGKVVADK